ncbi:PREDICTED: uncharacterized protein LOC106339138 [Brassica oleracea var. oleracea]|uniref:uncharacterized protein LOC106339138 n=1 Tax=Brassica oleracea var. oleracea TaxID=109376 RepID=UPI0006A74DE9|nr:PREDICTED: uncharacterized protein LOC106339138 [Brassica oleracea var. oleracea]
MEPEENSTCQTCKTFGQKCSHVVKKQRTKFYIIRRCIAMLVCWRDNNSDRSNRDHSSSLTRKSHEIPFEMEKVEQFEMSPGEKYLVNYSRPDPSDPDPEMSWG